MFPNPTLGRVTLQAEGMTHVMVIDALGRVVMDAPIEGDEASLDLSSYQDGLYLVRVETTDAVMMRRLTLAR